MQFSTSLEEILEQYKNKEKTYTENDAVAYKTSGKELLDFNFSITSMRNWAWQDIEKAFGKVFYENPKVAILYWFYGMDCLEGLGERNITKGIMHWLVNNHPEIIEKVYKYIPEYNRWDTLILLADPNFNNNEKLRELIVGYIEVQFVNDLKNAYSNSNSISLLAKWMPSENASSKETKRMALQLMQDLRTSPKYYRKALSLLRSKLNVVERDMSSNKWNNITYEHVPSKANLNYYKAFMRHDTERRGEYLNSLKKEKTKINSKVLAPYEICHRYGYYGYGYGYINPYDEALEQMWKALPQYQLGNVLVVRDGSGSMTDKITNTATCLDVATSLAIYAAEHNSKDWKDKFITFSNNPKFVDMSQCNSLRDKILLCTNYNECSNTDIYKTMKLILKTVIDNGYKQEEMPKSILIISDMQFDQPYPYFSYVKKQHGAFNYDKTLFESIKTEYMAIGYKLPKIIFWNVDSRGNKTIPMQENELGMSLISGFSANIFKMVLNDELDPYKELLKILYSKRYEKINLTLS